MAALALAPMFSVRASAATATEFQPLERMGYSALAGQVNTQFRVRLSPRRVVELTLLKVPLAPTAPIKPDRRPPADAGNEKFSLIFSGPKDALLPPAIHRFEHDQLGRLEMYIGQIGMPDTERVRYEAVFNLPSTSTTPI